MAVMTEDFTIKIGEFEGPLDVLLQLIEKRKLHISDVSLAQVADDFIAFIERENSLPKGAVTDFITVASTLILIKSLSLLPAIETTEEENKDIKELERRLAEYQKIKEQAQKIGHLFGRQIIFFRQANCRRPIVFSPTAEITIESLKNSIWAVIKSIPRPEKLPRTEVKKVISLEEVINNLVDRIKRALKINFSEFLGDQKKEKIAVIVNFLGVLELAKRGDILVNQAEKFSEIEIENIQADIPRY